MARNTHEKHTTAFDQNSRQYDWKRVNVRNRTLEQEIVRRTFIDDELARQEKEDATQAKGSFEAIFCSMRPAFDELFSDRPKQGLKRPATFADFVNTLQIPGGAF